jgi:hypothetical protein
MKTPASNVSGGGGGHKFLIQLQPNSSLLLQLVFRPGSTVLPLQLMQHSGADMPASTTSGSSNEGSVAASGPQAKVSSAAAGRRATAERRTSTAHTGVTSGSKPGSAAGGSRGLATAEPQLLAVPVTAEGALPRLILSKTAVDFGSRVARRALQSGKSPHLEELRIRNNTDAPIQVALGPPVAAAAAAGGGSAIKPGSSQHSSRPSDVCAFAVEGCDTHASAILEPGEQLAFSVRFSPTEARAYEAVVPVFVDGDRAAPHMQLTLAGAGTLPKLGFDVPECVLPTVRVWRPLAGWGHSTVVCALVCRLPWHAIAYKRWRCDDTHLTCRYHWASPRGRACSSSTPVTTTSKSRCACHPTRPTCRSP